MRGKRGREVEAKRDRNREKERSRCRSLVRRLRVIVVQEKWIKREEGFFFFLGAKVRLLPSSERACLA